MIIDCTPYIINPISKPLQFLFRNRNFFDGCLLEIGIFVWDEILKVSYLALVVFDESHDERFQLELLEKSWVFALDEIESDRDDWGHVNELKWFTFIDFLHVLLEDVVL